LNQSQLSKAMFPLGGLLKSQVRDIAREHQLSNHAKKTAPVFVLSANVLSVNF